MTPPARPRVEGDREEEILDAAVDLLIDQGYDRLTMDAVAREAHASKATLYRRWESKAALVIDALIRAKGMPRPAAEDTGTLRGDLIAAFCGRDGLGNARAGHVMGAVVTAVTTDPDFAERWRSEFIAPKLEVSREIFQRAIARGEMDPDADLEIIAPALAGVVLHRMYVMGAPPDDDTVERVVDHLILPAVRSTCTAGDTPRATPKRRQRA